uniref:Uncharacterized protein n=1 Tax=Romanomermis culicivorax TaxID=13658 RepID=A0A915J9P1_ROMCU
MIVLEMAVPILLEAPAITSFGLNHFTSGLPEWATALCCGLFIFHATTDPMSMIYVIKPYRKAFLKWCHKVRGKTVISSHYSLASETDSNRFGTLEILWKIQKKQ